MGSDGGVRKRPYEQRHGGKGVKKAGAAGMGGRRRVGGMVVAALLGGVAVGGLGLTGGGNRRRMPARVHERRAGRLGCAGNGEAAGRAQS